MRKGAATDQPDSTNAQRSRAKPLSPAHSRFVAEYLRSHNATEAYLLAYPNSSRGAAATGGSRLLKNAHIREQIAHTEAEILEQAKAETGITLERTLRAIGQLAFFDIRRLLRPDGTPKSLTELDEEEAAAIAGLELQSMLGDGKESGLLVRKYKLSDRRAALDMLMRHLGGYKEDNKQQGGLAELLSQVKRSSVPIAATVPAEGDDE